MSVETLDPVETRFFTFAETEDEAFDLELGGKLWPVTLAYETYGELNADRSNAILVFHALSGSQHAAGINRSVPGLDGLWTEENYVGWWHDFIGPGKAFDTRRYFVICANYIGGSYGSTAPRTTNPQTGKPWGGSFPYITMGDVVNTQVRLLDHLGIQTLFAVVGSSIGGMLALDYASRYAERVRCVIAIATGARTTTLQKLHNFEQIFAIEEDANFARGDYYEGEEPLKGLMLARMIGQKTFVSLEVLQDRARGEIIQDENDLKGYRLQHRIESYMLHQAKKFVTRYDANSYLCVLGMWSSFDLTRKSKVPLNDVFAPCQKLRFLVFSIDSDVCYFPEQQNELCAALQENNINYQHITVHSLKGHDSFLLEPHLFTPYIVYVLDEIWRQGEAAGI